MTFLWNPWNVLMRMRSLEERKKEENDTFCTSGVARAVLITTGTKLLDTKYVFH